MKRILLIILTFILFVSIAFATVTNTVQPPKQYTANGITTNFPITFDYVNESDLTVTFVTDDGDSAVWVQDAVGDEGYTIVSDEVVANTAPDDGTLTIDGETPRTQELNLKNNRATPAELYEAALDKLTLEVRDLKAQIDRAMVADATSDPDIDYTAPDYEASTFWQWHPSEKKLRNATLVGIAISIGTDIGDIVELIDDGSGNAAFPAFPLSGPLDSNSFQIQESIGANVASASALAILTDGNKFYVTGTTNIDSINSTGKIGSLITLEFVTGTLDLNHDATDLILLGGENITTTAGSIAVLREYALGDFKLEIYQDGATAPGGGGIVLLSTVTASSDATIDIDALIDGTYDEYEIHLQNVIPASDNVGLNLLTSTDGGSNYDTGASDYGWIVGGNSGGGTGLDDGDVADSEIQLSASYPVGSAANEVGVSGVISLIRPSVAKYGTILYQIGYRRETAEIVHLEGYAERLTAADINAVRFIFTSGAIESGEFKLYGLKKSL